MPSEVTIIIRQRDIALIETENGICELEMLSPNSTKMFRHRDGRLEITVGLGSETFALTQIVKVEDKVRGLIYDQTNITRWWSSLPEANGGSTTNKGLE